MHKMILGVVFGKSSADKIHEEARYIRHFQLRTTCNIPHTYQNQTLTKATFPLLRFQMSPFSYHSVFG